MSATISDNSFALYAVVDKKRKVFQYEQECSSHSPHFPECSLVDAASSTNDEDAKDNGNYSVDLNYIDKDGETNEKSSSIYSVLEQGNMSKSVNIHQKRSLPMEKIKNEKLNKSFWILFILLTVGLLLLFAIAFIAVVASFYSDISILKTNVESDFRELSNNFTTAVANIMELNRAISAMNNSYSSLETTVNMIASNLPNNQNFSYSVLIKQGNSIILAIPFASSCKDIFTHHSSLPSGYYWLSLSNGSGIEVYCEMTMTCDGITGGWTRVGKLNKFNNGSAQCFQNLTNYGGNGNQCIRNTNISGCSHIFFQVFDMQYSHVCGTIQGYGLKSTDGFRRRLDINQNYVDGISLTYGNPERNHIWTFAAKKTGSCDYPYKSEFVMNNYSCMTQINNIMMNCPSNRCLPEFSRQLENSISEDIEMRVCRSESRSNEDIILDNVEIYVR